MSKYNFNPFKIFETNPDIQAFFSLNEQNKLELYVIDKDYYTNLPDEKKKLIKRNFLWSRTRSAWVGRTSIGYVPRGFENWDIPYIQLPKELMKPDEKRENLKERAERKSERLAGYAENNYKKSIDQQAEFRRLAKDNAWLTQPNHLYTASGRAFAKSREKVLNRFEKGFETYGKAQYLEERAKDYQFIAKEKDEQLKNFSYLENRIKENQKSFNKIGDYFERAEEALKNENLATNKRIDINARVNYFKQVIDKLFYYNFHMEKLNKSKKESGEMSLSELKERIKGLKKLSKDYFKQKYNIDVTSVSKNYGTGIRVNYILRAKQNFPEAYQGFYANKAMITINAFNLIHIIDAYNKKQNDTVTKTKEVPDILLIEDIKPKPKPKNMATKKTALQSFLNFGSTPATKKKTGGKIVKMNVKKKPAAKKPAAKKPAAKKPAAKKKTYKPLTKLPAKLKGKATLAQLNKARKSGSSVTISKNARQVGSSSKFQDLIKAAKQPGKRLTPAGTIYYENRKNRSDKKGSSL